MHSSVAILLVLGLAPFIDGAAISPHSKSIGLKMAIPHGYTREQYMKSIVDYWTPERMASAKPLTPMITRHTETPFTVDKQDNRPERILTPSTFVPASRSSIPKAAGRVFFVMDGRNYVCSGSVVNAKNRDMVVSAGHCVFNTTSKEWATNWMFVPHFKYYWLIISVLEISCMNSWEGICETTGGV